MGIEDEAKQQAEIDKEEQALNSVDLGLTKEQELTVVARQRLAYANQYILLQTNKLALVATLKIGGDGVSKDIMKTYADNLARIEIDAKHCLRAIYQIDKKYSTAKEAMSKLSI